MIVSFTYQATLLIAQRLIDAPYINKVYLQAHKIATNKDSESIVIKDGESFEAISWNDLEGVVCYFRDIGSMQMVDAGDDACYNNFRATQNVRLVVYCDALDYNSNQLSKLILSQLRGFNIQSVNMDDESILSDELSKIDIARSPRTYILAVDFVVEEYIQLDQCLIAIDCSIEDLIICK